MMGLGQAVRPLLGRMGLDGAWALPAVRLLAACALPLALAACGGSAYPGPGAEATTGTGGPRPLQNQAMPVIQALQQVPASQGRRVAILLPLSGANAGLGQAMLKAAQLALDGPDAPELLPLDTAGTAEGAANAVQQAGLGGAGIILGPLTGAETAAAAPVARSLGMPVLAFTNDPTQQQPGVWTLGIGPAEQVRRLVAAVAGQGKTKFAALLPDNAFGTLLGEALARTAPSLNASVVSQLRYGQNFAELNTAAKEIAGYATRRAVIDADVRKARAKLTPEGRKEAREAAAQPVPPPPYDALLVGEAGPRLQELIPLLQAYDISPAEVKIIGPALWDNEAPRLGALSGAWYAAPDPAARAGFDQAYTAKFGSPAPRIADLAFDAAAIARLAAGPGGFSTASITRPEGFSGANGLLQLQPDGRVRRGLAVFEIDRGGSHIVEPAPTSLAAPDV